MKYPLQLALHLALATTLSACASAPPENSAKSGPDRIVSLDYCADQMLLGLVPKSRIAAVSVDVASDPLFAEPLARGLPRVRPDVERVLALRPTLVVRSYGGGPRMESSLRRAGVPVFTLPYAEDFDGIRHAITASGAALNAPAAATRRLAEFETALATAAANRGAPPQTALYVTPGDVTTGPDSQVGRLFTAAGLSSYQSRAGWHRLPIEQLAAQPPDLVVRGFFDSPAHKQDRWSSSAHRVLQTSIATVPQVDVPGSEIACGNWLAGRALMRLVQTKQELSR